MATIDPFLTDAFTLTNLTAAIDAVTYTPTILGDQKLFTEGGITTTTAMIESDGTSVGLVSVQPRNAPGQIVLNDKRTMRSFIIPHLPERATIMADEVQNVRSFGSENAAETIQSIINMRLEKMRRQIDYTMELHRLSALMGLYYNAAGGTTSLFTEFGVSQDSVNMALTTTSTNIKGKIQNIIEYIEANLDGIAFSGITVYCGSTFWESFISHGNVEKFYLSWTAANALNTNPMQPFPFMGILWQRYRGTSACKVPDAEAYAVPTGVDDLFITRYAPANYMETVNTMGRPYYAKAEPMEMNKGMNLEAQSNPINLCTRPAAVIKLTRA